jgi:acetyl esterase/lipase
MPRGLFGPEISVQKNPEYYKAVSPYHNIPDTSLVRLPPIMFTVGSDDPLVPPASVQDFSEKLKATGQGPISYWEYQGQSHAFLDGGAGFNEKAVPALDKMLNFLDSIFYK